MSQLSLGFNSIIIISKMVHLKTLYLLFDYIMLKFSKEHLLPNPKVSFNSLIYCRLSKNKQLHTYTMQVNKCLFPSCLVAGQDVYLKSFTALKRKQHCNFGSFASDT